MENLPTVVESRVVVRRSALFIGDVARLTGISAGRIRHYESLGLLAPGHLASGYRTFGPDEVLLLLRIDLLRSLGMGLAEIGSTLRSEPDSLRDALRTHRALLAAEHSRIERLLEAVDAALGAASDPEALVARLATTHRDSLGLLGRLSRPLSARATARYLDVFARWSLPVAPMFGQMVLPEPVTDFLEELSTVKGVESFFGQLYQLAGDVFGLGAGGDAAPLARRWVAGQLALPASDPVGRVLRRHVPRLAALTTIRQGFLMWAESVSPVAQGFLLAVEKEAVRRNAAVVGVLVVPVSS